MQDLTAWAIAQLGGDRFVHEISVVRNWTSSKVIRLDGPKGTYYAKQCARQFLQEIGTTLGLADLVPEHVPTPVAIDFGAGRFLSKDSGAPLRGTNTVQHCLVAAKAIARIHNRTQHELDRFRTLPRFSDIRLQSSVGSLTAWLIERVGSEKSFSELTAIMTVVECAELPPTLVHGDLSGGNIRAGSKNLNSFDKWIVCLHAA